ncbi:1,3-beta-glucanase [Gracilaria domingensis]|nr:1,3-beta-glucanase [Gracilaria domingensis]KAI0561509.1 1,3-beta-glucanase [Gracilaria domingensis]
MQGYRWKVSDGYANGVPFNCWWSKTAAAIDGKNGELKLTLSKQHNHGKPYKSGQLMSHNWHGYGCYEVRMRPVAQPGVITTFFSYTGPWDAAPGKSKAHNEIDVEFVWKNGKLTLQANYFTNGQGGNEHLLPINFNPAASMNNYGFKWTSNSIMWFVNGKMVYKTSKNIPKAHQAPHKIMMSLWPVSWQAAQWGGTYEYKGHRTAAYAANV